MTPNCSEQQPDVQMSPSCCRQGLWWCSFCAVDCSSSELEPGYTGSVVLTEQAAVTALHHNNSLQLQVRSSCCHVVPSCDHGVGMWDTVAKQAGE